MLAAIDARQKISLASRDEDADKRQRHRQRAREIMAVIDDLAC